jgi:MoaA/NifB/PqqE/SkfB family radical SAM enzyme
LPIYHRTKEYREGHSQLKNLASQKFKHFINKTYRGIRLYYSGGSLKSWQLLTKHLCRKLINGNVPNLITIGLTYRCQCNCVHCSANVPNRIERPELETRQVKEIIDQAKRLGIIRVTFFGGEPVLRDDICDLVRYAHDAGMITRINTNGWLLNRELVSNLKAAGLTMCDVSIDDPDPQMHDSLRGRPGLYAKAVDGIQILKEFKIPCEIVTYASKRIVPLGLEDIISMGKRLKVFAVSIVFPMATGCWHESFEELLTEEEKEEVRKFGDFHLVHVEMPSHSSKCNVAKKAGIYVSPEGNVTPCPFVPYVIGNMGERELEEIWNEFARRSGIGMSGECPMNSPESRQHLKSSIEAINGDLKAKARVSF